jgi:hypothetical protein
MTERQENLIPVVQGSSYDPYGPGASSTLLLRPAASHAGLARTSSIVELAGIVDLTGDMETDIVTLEVLIDELSADQLFVVLGLCSWIKERGV